MVIAVRAVLVALFICRHILPESPAAAFAHEYHLGGLRQRVGLFFGVAFGALIPFFAAWSADRYLCVQYMFAAGL
jgi:hypothetical protein